MKKLLSLFAASILMVACGEKAESESTPETETSVTEAIEPEEVLNFYGVEITTDDAIPSSELIALLEENDSVQVKVEGKIKACCKKKGCWMDVDLGNGLNMIVRFKDYDFFVPKNADGQMAVMEGIAKMEVQTVDWLQHKAHDAGKSEEEIAAITEPEVSVSFMADGVIIKGETPEEVETEKIEDTPEVIETSKAEE